MRRALYASASPRHTAYLNRNAGDWAAGETGRIFAIFHSIPFSFTVLHSG